MDLSTMNIWYWLMLVVTGVIGGLVGYFMGKSNAAAVNTSDDQKRLLNKNLKLQADLDACRKKRVAQPSGNKNVSSSVGAQTANPVVIGFEAAIAQTAFGKNIEKDDLKVIEGIGPKIEGMFHTAGIETWKALSETSVASCREILNRGGVRYKVHDPASWPMQAKMCYMGKWKELYRWQVEHDYGKL